MHETAIGKSNALKCLLTAHGLKFSGNKILFKLFEVHLELSMYIGEAS